MGTAENLGLKGYFLLATTSQCATKITRGRVREKREREKEEVRKREGAARKKGNGEAENCRGVKELRGCVGQTEGTETDPLYSPAAFPPPCRVASKNTERFIFIECARAMIQFRPIERERGEDRHGYGSHRIYEIDTRVLSAVFRYLSTIRVF